MRKFPKLEQLSAQKFEQVSNEALERLNGGKAIAEEGCISFIQGENTYVTVNTDIIGHLDGGGTVIINC